MSLHQPWHRSLNNRVFAGVCGGLAETWGTDSSLIRLFWVLFTLWTHAAGIILYLVAALLLPTGAGESGGSPEEVINEENESCPENESRKVGGRPSNRRVQQWVGLMLMLAGGYWLIERFLPNVVDEIRKVAFPLILIALGLWLVLKEKHGEGE